MTQGSRKNVTPYAAPRTCTHNYFSYLGITSEKDNTLFRSYFCVKCKYKYHQVFYTRDMEPPTKGTYDVK
jgi:hypothetical protein